MALLMPFVWSDHFNGDEFHFLAQVKRIVAGEVPTRDFFEFVMPGSLLLTAAWFKLTGPSLLAARLLQGGLVAALALVYLRLGRRLGLSRGIAALPPALLLGVFYAWHPAYSHHWFGQVGVGAALLAAWWALGRERPAAWAVVGAAVGATYLMQQMTGLALLAGVGLWALWVAWRQAWGWRMTARRAGLFLLGVAGPLVALAGYFAWHGTLAQAVWMTHVWSLSNYRSVGNHNDVAFLTDLSWMLSPRRIWINLPYWYAGLSVYVFTALLPLAALFGGGAWMLGQARANDRRTAFVGVLVTTSGLLFLAATRGRADLTHIMYMAAPATLLLAVAIAESQRRVPGLLGRLPLLLAGGVVASQLYMEVQEFRQDPDSILSWKPPDARITEREAFRVLRAQVSPDDRILAINGAAEAAIFYFYLGRNPTRYTSWTTPEDGYTTPEQFREILGAVAASPPKLVLFPHVSPEAPDRFMASYFPAYRRVSSVPFPEDVPWTRTRTVFVYQR